MPAERLHKVMARLGVSSRRGAEAMIAAGQVTVNGQVARVGDPVDIERDIVEVRGRRIGEMPPRPLYLALNKPPGYVTSLRSTHGERTVVELLPSGERLIPVGRLDRDTSGLLLLTNDGEWANLVTHPRYGIEKQYEVLVEGRLRPEALNHLRRGIGLPDGAMTAPARIGVEREGRDHTLLSVTVMEGKKRQIRLMFAAVGHAVIRLRRVRIGPVVLGRLPEGRWRALQPEEVEGIRESLRRSGPGSSPTSPVDRDRRARRRR